MKKFQIFLLVEALIMTMALITLFSNSVSRFVVMIVLLLILLKFYRVGDKINLLLTMSSLILFMLITLNPFVIIGLLLAVAYIVINHFAQVKQKNRDAILYFVENGVSLKHNPHQWLGYQVHLDNDSYVFDDINVIRLSGTDVINLNDVILSGCDNVIMIRKIYGPTKIIVPVDVGVRLDLSSVYGQVNFLNQSAYDLRNESIKLQTKNYPDAVKKVKIVINVLAGETEVVRA